MPAIERVVVRRPLRFIRNVSPKLAADGVLWRLRNDGSFQLMDFGEKGNRPRIPVEALAYLRPLFEIRDVELRVSESVLFSTKPGLVPNMSPNGRTIFYNVDGRWLYMTKSGLLDLIRQL